MMVTADPGWRALATVRALAAISQSQKHKGLKRNPHLYLQRDLDHSVFVSWCLIFLQIYLLSLAQSLKKPPTLSLSLSLAAILYISHLSNYLLSLAET